MSGSGPRSGRAPGPVAFASDHAGFILKEDLKALVSELGIEVLDLGTDSEIPVDYPDYGHCLAAAILEGRARLGVAICGSGVGISIAANRHSGIRAALCHDEMTAELARRHNDANVLALGSRATEPDTAKACLRAFLSSRFEGGRHVRRVGKLG